MAIYKRKWKWSCSVVSDSLRPHGLYPAKLLYLWDSPGKNNAVGCHFLLQGIFLTQGLNPGLPHWRQTLYPLSHQGSFIYLLREMTSKSCFVWLSPVKKKTQLETSNYSLPSNSYILMYMMGFLVAQWVKNLPAMWGRLDPWVRKIPRRKKWQPTPVFLPEISHGQRSLAAYSPQGSKELDTTEQLTKHVYMMEGKQL